MTTTFASYANNEDFEPKEHKQNLNNVEVNKTSQSKQNLEAKPVANESMILFGRECCTFKRTSPDGTSHEVTACAGWFLSNSENAKKKACVKAYNAHMSYMIY